MLFPSLFFKSAFCVTSVDGFYEVFPGQAHVETWASLEETSLVNGFFTSLNSALQRMPTLEQRPEPELKAWPVVQKTNYVCHVLQHYYTMSVQPAISSRYIRLLGYLDRWA